MFYKLQINCFVSIFVLYKILVVIAIGIKNSFFRGAKVVECEGNSYLN